MPNAAPGATAKPCSRCREVKPLEEFPRDSGKRDGLSTRCKPCNVAEAEAWRQANPERYAARMKAWTQNNPEERRRIGRRHWLRKAYGITVEHYEALLKAQGGVCAICGGTDPAGRMLAVDHDHATLAIRGLLCFGCNVAVGIYERSREGIEAYLEKYR